MTSTNFNASATTALRTLQMTNKSLETTQNRVSTGLKIGEAKDNAAYWSISTTLKSDNKAMGTVKDALNLGAATVDTAYQGLNKAVEVLNEMKSKLTAASQDGVDKKAVQAEIVELQKQLKSIAVSSTFSGENWLSVNSDAVASYTAIKEVVSSFTRNANGSVSIGTVEVPLAGMSLIDASTTKSGILDGGKSGNAVTGALTAATGTATPASAGGAGTKSVLTTGVINVAALANSDVVTLGVSVGGTPISGVSYTYTTGDNIDDVVSAFTTALSGQAVVTKNSAGTALVFTSVADGAQVSITAVNANATTAGFAIMPGSAGSVGGSATTAAGAKATTTTAFTSGFTIDADDTISFDIAVDGGAVIPVTVDRAVVDAALGAGANGLVNTAAQYASVVQKALEVAGVGNVTVSVGTSTDLDKLVFTGTNTTATGAITVTNVAADDGTNVLELDISTANRQTIERYVEVVNRALTAATSAAANLGAVASRIDLQQTFVSTLMDTIEKGISGLIDADLSEESTRLQALQTKQQLGVQALSIANQSTQQILRLFQ